MIIRGNAIDTRVMINDAGSLMDEQKAEKRGRLNEAGTFAYDEYLDYGELEEWLSTTAEQYSDHTELINLATTAEGRTLWGLHMGDKDHTGVKKKVFMGVF